VKTFSRRPIPPQQLALPPPSKRDSARKPPRSVNPLRLASGATSAPIHYAEISRVLFRHGLQNRRLPRPSRKPMKQAPPHIARAGHATSSPTPPRSTIINSISGDLMVDLSSRRGRIAGSDLLLVHKKRKSIQCPSPLRAFASAEMPDLRQRPDLPKNARPRQLFHEFFPTTTTLRSPPNYRKGIAAHKTAHGEQLVEERGP